MVNKDNADRLFGKRSPISDEVINLIANPDLMDDGKPFPVQIVRYIDPATHTPKNQLDSRGIRYDRGLTESSPGIQRISTRQFRKLSRGTPTVTRIEHNDQSAISVQVTAHLLPDKKLSLRTQLLPNDHNIRGLGSRHYLIETQKLHPVYREFHPRVKSIGGVNFGMLIKSAIVDLINK